MESFCALRFVVSCAKYLFNEVLPDVEIRHNLFNKVHVSQLALKIESNLK